MGLMSTLLIGEKTALDIGSSVASELASGLRTG